MTSYARVEMLMCNKRLLSVVTPPTWDILTVFLMILFPGSPEQKERLVTRRGAGSNGITCVSLCKWILGALRTGKIRPER